MSERAAELQAIIDAVGRRWRGRLSLQALGLGAFAAALFLGAGWLAVALVARDGVPLVVVAAVVLVGATFALGRAYWLTRGSATAEPAPGKAAETCYIHA